MRGVIGDTWHDRACILIKFVETFVAPARTTAGAAAYTIELTKLVERVLAGADNGTIQPDLLVYFTSVCAGRARSSQIEIRPIPNWESRYLASADGQIFSLKTCRPIFQERNPVTGRMQVILWRERVKKTAAVHQLVCAAFHGSKPSGKEASHLNGDCVDNRAENLKWETCRQNFARKIEHGTDDNGCRNSRAALQSPVDLARVRELIADNVPYRQICAEFGIKSRATLTRIKKGERYARW